MAREQINRPEGFVDPSASFTDEQKETFLKEILHRGPDGKWIDHDETIDTYINEVNASKSIISNLNRNELMMLEGGAKQLTFCTYETFLDRLSKVNHIGKLAFRALILMVETEIRIGRENQLFGMGNEANAISTMISNLGYRKRDPGKDTRIDNFFFNLKEALDEFFIFSDNVFKSRVYSIREGVDPVTLFNMLRCDVTVAAANIVVENNYNILDYVPRFVHDVPTSSWMYIMEQDSENKVIVPATEKMKDWIEANLSGSDKKYLYVRINTKCNGIN